MEIDNSKNGKYNFSDDLKPLFDAMKEGKIIKSVTLMKGASNKSDPSQDFKIENFVALSYYVGAGYSPETGNCDCVETDSNVAKHKNFYMCWVRAFELY